MFYPPSIEKLGQIMLLKNFMQKKLYLQQIKSKFNTISKNFAFIEFDFTGKIINANKKFLDLMEYELHEIQGQHHRLFTTPKEATSSEYKRFWIKLLQGQTQTQEFIHKTKTGKTIHLQASYMPMENEKNQVTSVIKIVMNYTEQKHERIFNTD